MNRYLFLLLFFLSNQSMAQVPNFIHFDSPEVFSGGEVYYVTEDHLGRIWFATDHGVSYYDGYELQTFTTSDGLPDNTVFEIYEDDEDRIWFISYSMQLSYFKDGEIHVYEYNDKISEQFNYHSIYCPKSFFVDSNNIIHISFKANGYLTISPNGNVENEIMKDHSSSDVFFCIKKDGHLFTTSTSIKMGNLVYISNGQKKVFPDFFIENLNHSSYNLKMNVVEFMGEVWISRGRILYCLKNGNKPVKIFDQDIIRLNVNDNHLFVSERNQGLKKYALTQGELVLKSTFLSDYSISSCFFDSEGGQWISTLQNGVFYWPDQNIYKLNYGQNKTFINISYSNNLELLSAIESNGSAHVFNRNGTEVKIPNTQKTSYSQWVENRLFLAQDHSLQIWSFENLSGKIKSQFKSKLPITAYNFLKRANSISILEKRRISEYTLNGELIQDTLIYHPKFKVNELIETEEGLFLATNSGLYLYKNDNLISLGQKYPELNQRISSIIKWNNKLFIATRHDGIYVLKNSKLLHLTKESGLSNDMIYGMKRNLNYIYILTPSGITRISTNNYECKSSTSTTGLGMYDFNDFIIRDNDIVIATNNGFLVVDFATFDKKVYKKQIRFGQISLGNQRQKPNVKGISQYSNSSFKVDFNGAPLSGGKSTVYKYRLIQNGKVLNWNTTKNREINYPYLEPGSYVFEVTVDTPNYPHNTIKYSFEIETPYWAQTKFIILFIVLGAILIAVVISLIYRTRIKSLKRRHLLQHQVYNYKLLALSRQINPHFIFNALNSVQNYILKNDKLASSEYLSRFGGLMRKMLDHCQDNLVTVKQELNILKEYVELEQLRFNNQFDWNIEYPDENILSIRIPPALLQPLIENAIWHGLMPLKNNGTLRIDFIRSEQHVNCRIMDNGIGRKASRESKLNSTKINESKGNIITAERLEVLNSYYGTQFKMTIEDLEPEKTGDIRTIVNIQLPYL